MERQQSRARYLRVCVAAGLLAGLVTWLPVAAQTFRGSIIGTVSDPSGAVVAGATVSAKNTGTGLGRTTQTSADGTYSIPELAVGSYQVTASKSGFQTAVAEGVSVEVARERHVDFTLKPGNISQQVQVTEEAAQPIETTNNTLGIQFESKDIVDLPINGRDIDKLYIMSPGVTGDPSGAGGSPGSYGQFSANGNRDRANNFLLDGTDMNDSYRNLPAINQGGVFAVPAPILPLESIAEVRLLTNFDAEYGRSAGSVVNIVTKSGTNEFHGSLFEYFRNSVLNARNFFATEGPKDGFRNNQFGGALGGPVIKKKTFFFASYEGQREGLGLTSLNTVPALSDYAAAIAAIPGGNATACTTTVFACVMDNSAVVNSVILKYYNLCNTKGGCSGGNSPWPLPNLATPIDGFNNVSSDASFNNVDSGTIKIDHSFNSANTLSGRYYYGTSHQSFPLGISGGNNIPNTNTVSPVNVNLVSISLVSVVSPTQVNEARFGYNRFHEGFFSQSAGTVGNPQTSLGLNTCLGLVTGQTIADCGAAALPTANPDDYGLPEFVFDSGLSSLGGSAFSTDRDRIDRNYQFVDNFSWKFAKNDVKMGWEYRHTSVDSLQDLVFRGEIEFPDLTNFLEGNIDGGVINYGTTKRYSHQDSNSLFIQDSWQIRPRLTLNAGIRWDYYGVIREGLDNISDYNPVTGLVPMNEPYKPDWNNFAPRISLAWDPFGNGKTVVRAGAASFYDSFSFDYFFGQLYFNTANLGPAYNAVGADPVFQSSPVVATLAPGVPVFDTSAAGLGADTTGASTVGHLVTPYVNTFTLNVQQQLTANTVLQVGYVGTQGRKLQRIVDLDQPSQAAITAYDVTAIAESPTTAACPGAGMSDGAGVPLSCSIFPLTVPRNYNNEGPGFLTLPGQDNEAAVMSSLAPQPPSVLQQLQTSARSNYNSLQISITQRNWHGVTQQINYTWSHTLDDASDGQDYVPHTGQPNDSTNPHGSNYGNSNFDERNHFIWTLEYAFPKAHALGRFGEGWIVSSVVTIQSGHPFDMINTDDDYDGSGEFYGRPDLVSKPIYNFSNPAQFLNVSSFAVQCTLSGQGAAAPDGNGTEAQDCLSGTRHFGTEGRNVLVGPPFRQWDFSLVKNTKITERTSLQLRADAFNLLNHPNFSNPLLPDFESTLSGFPINPTTGRFSGYYPITATVDTGIGNPILAGGGPRSFQLAAKFIF